MFNLYLNYVFLYLKLRKKFLKTGLGGEKITISQLLSTSKFCNFVSCPKITRIYILYKAECRYFLVEGDGGSQLWEAEFSVFSSNKRFYLPHWEGIPSLFAVGKFHLDKNIRVEYLGDHIFRGTHFKKWKTDKKMSLGAMI